MTFLGEKDSDTNSDPNGLGALELPHVNLNNRPKAHLKLPRSFIETKSIGKILYACGLAASGSEGHRLASMQAVHVGGGAAEKKEPMRDGAVNWNRVKLWKPEETKNFLIDGKLLLLRRGKSNVRFIEVVEDAEYEDSGLTFPGDGVREADLTKKIKEKLPSAASTYISDESHKPAPNYAPAWANVDKMLNNDVSDQMRHLRENTKWNSNGALRDSVLEEIDVETIDLKKRVDELEQNLANTVALKKSKLDIKQAPKGKFMGHGLPRGPVRGHWER